MGRLRDGSRLPQYLASSVSGPYQRSEGGAGQLRNIYLMTAMLTGAVALARNISASAILLRVE